MKILFDPSPPDAPGASSTPSDANVPPADSSPAAPIDAKTEDKTFDQLAEAVVTAKLPVAKETVPVVSSPAEPAPAKVTPPAGDVLDPNKTGAQLPGEFEDLPFHKHERFQQVVKERKEFKETLEQAKPAIERLRVIDDFCQGNRINDKQFKEILEVQALINTNPGEAWKRLQPVIEHLSKYQGMSLSPDLQEAVDAGKLPLEYAQRLAAAEQQKKFVEQSTAENALHGRQQVLYNTLTSWEKQIQQTDPDYSRKQQMVIDRFVALTAREPWQTPDQCLALAQRAYADVNTSIQGFVPRPAPIKTLTTNGASSAQKAEPKTWEEAGEYVASKYASR